MDHYLCEMENPEIILDDPISVIVPVCEQDHQHLDKKEDTQEEENPEEGLDYPLNTIIPKHEIDPHIYNTEEETLDLGERVNPEDALDNPIQAITPDCEQDHQHLDKQEDTQEEENPEEGLYYTIQTFIPVHEMDPHLYNTEEETIALEARENPEDTLHNPVHTIISVQGLGNHLDVEENINLHEKENLQDILHNSREAKIPVWEPGPNDVGKNEDTTEEEKINLYEVENLQDDLSNPSNANNTVLEPDHCQCDSQEDTPVEENTDLQRVENPEEALDNPIHTTTPDRGTDKNIDKPEEEELHLHENEDTEDVLQNPIHAINPDWELVHQHVNMTEQSTEEENLKDVLDNTVYTSISVPGLDHLDNENIHEMESSEDVLDNLIIPIWEPYHQHHEKLEGSIEEIINLPEVEHPQELLDQTNMEWELDHQLFEKLKETTEIIHLPEVEHPQELLDQTNLDRESEHQHLEKLGETIEEIIHLPEVEYPQKLLDQTSPDWEPDHQDLQKLGETTEEIIYLPEVEYAEELLDQTNPDWKPDHQDLEKMEETTEEIIHIPEVEHPQELLDQTNSQWEPDHQDLEKLEETTEEIIHLPEVEHPQELLEQTNPDWEPEHQDLEKLEETTEIIQIPEAEHPQELRDQTNPDWEPEHQDLEKLEETTEVIIHLPEVEHPQELLDQTNPDCKPDYQELEKLEETTEEIIHLPEVEQSVEILGHTNPDWEPEHQDLEKLEETTEEIIHLPEVEHPEELLDQINPVWEPEQQYIEKMEDTTEEISHLPEVEHSQELLDQTNPDWESDHQPIEKLEETIEDIIHLPEVEHSQELLDQTSQFLEPDQQYKNMIEESHTMENIYPHEMEKLEASDNPVNAAFTVLEIDHPNIDNQTDFPEITLHKVVNPNKVSNNPIYTIDPVPEPQDTHLGKDLDEMILNVSHIPEHAWDFKIKTFHEKLKELNMEKFITSKLSLSEVLKIGQDNLKKIVPQRMEDIPWFFLQNLMALNGSARNTRLDQSLDTKPDGILEEDMDFLDNMDTLNSIHPLDVLCILLYCSDSFLQQEMVTKMSMCQFAVPLLLPDTRGLECTFMLWATREIVKRWRPHSLTDSKGCREDNLVNIPMPVFSFVRIGKCNLSKSKILNYMLSPPQQHHDFFVHQNMEGANISKEISEGLVEIAWFFPVGRENFDLFPDPIAVTNLRGDLESNWSQFTYLTKISTAVFIFIEDLDNRQCRLLANIEEANTNYFIIIAPTSRCVSIETQKHIKTLYPILKINRKNVLVKSSSINDAELVKKLHIIIADQTKSSPYYITLEEMSHIAGDLGIQADENSEEHQNTRKIALEICKSIKDVVQYKNETMILQGDLWKQLAKTEKEMCRMKGLGNDNTEDYKNKLVRKCFDLRRQQSEFSLPNGMVRFIDAITNLPRVEKHYFLKWLKLYLDSVSRNHLCALQAEYKEHCYNMTTNVDKLIQLDQIISNSSLGIEHFIREVGQFYEAECFLAKDCIHAEKELYKLPGIAADLLLDGFPLELIDGDASNIPLQWITDVLTELDIKTGGQCRMRVITVLGVQSTGKSTLLNTMFGLQFPVASGRCTRGAFMTLIKVKETFKEEMGCEFILVLDTEGLKAPELAFLEDSYEHDNELATLVVGLSDITIINMAMENTTDIRDILQIVVHAFLRMKEVGKKTNCQFVHQNVSDVSAHDKNMRDRKKFLEQLDEMTNVASRMEENDNVTKFSDVMDYDFEDHSWYIPGLWHGVPPMASVNTGYSENIFELKIHLFDIMKKQLETRRPQTISDFIKWIKSLWNAVKYEKFLFSFRNSLVAEAYNQLSIKYSELEWNFRKRMHKWMMETENQILNQTDSELEAEIWTEVKKDMYHVLQEEEKVMLEELEKYFESGNKYVHLVERYREDFFRSVMTLRKEIQDNLGILCEEAIRIQRGKHELQLVQDSYLKTLEEKSTSLLDNCRNLNNQLSDEELKSEFEAMWNLTISGLQFRSLKKHNIGQEMVEQLRKDMRHKAGYINEKLNEVKSLDDHSQNGLAFDKKYTQSIRYENMPEKRFKECRKMVNDLVTSLKDQCNQRVTEQLNTMKDYHQTYCQELLNIINDRLNQDDVRNLHLTPLFELDLKLHLLGRIAPLFQKKHNIFFQENSMKLYLDKLKPQYFSTFKNLYNQKDESKVRAQKFCETCLKPALSDYVYKNLGGEIVNDILTSGDSIRYSSRTFFQYTLLKELLEDHIFTQYVKYNNHYETFVKNWIIKYITEKYKESTSLESLRSNILATISRKVRDVLKSLKVGESSDVSQCLKTFCSMLKKHLVVSQNEMKVIVYQNKANPRQFVDDILEFLPDIEKQITTDIKHFTIDYVLSKATLKPQDELFKKVFGCGEQCPFCKVPCEAGAADHKEHFASVHRPQGLGTYRCTETKALSYSICSTDVVGNTTFLNSDTEWKPCLYKEYRKFYPDWTIQPDITISASDYWKFVFKEFNKEFSDYSNAKTATLPEDWYKLTKEQALQSLKESFNMY